MNTAAELFHRDCQVSDATGVVAPLVVTFYAPLKNPQGDDYLSRARISCRFFTKDVYGLGSDAAQSFFSLPIAVVSYLIGRRRYGFETYLFEKGDLDYSNFWTYQP
ncbi:MAG: hypothetical protein P4M09_02520 [Devosia sp.]|nr:hypothetical protein [Devosia sp.]